jgi:hypothetical protein
MKIVYRISPYKPDNLPVFFPDDKFKLVEMCHNSFLKAGGSNYEVTYICDGCDWSKDWGKTVEINKHSKVGSLLTAYETALNLNDDVLFLEDDYLWRPDTLPLMEKALEILPVLSPYDHPYHYIEERFDKHFEMKLIGTQTYRTCPSNTHTFGIQNKIFRDNYDHIVKCGVEDHRMFSELNKVAQLWCPVPSFATHLASGCLAPNVNWLSLQT